MDLLILDLDLLKSAILKTPVSKTLVSMALRICPMEEFAQGASRRRGVNSLNNQTVVWGGGMDIWRWLCDPAGGWAEPVSKTPCAP